MEKYNQIIADEMNENQLHVTKAEDTEVINNDSNPDNSHASDLEESIYNDFQHRFENTKNGLEDDEVAEVVTVDESAHTMLEKSVLEYQNGIQKSFDYIYNFYYPKLNRLSIRKNDEDLVQELSIVLLKAIETYDKNAGAKFNTYFWKCAKNHIGTLNIRKSAKKRTAEFGVVSAQQSISANDQDTEIGDFIEDKSCEMDYDEKIFRMFLDDNVYKHLKDNEIKAIEMLLLGYTLEEIGAALGGITAPAVHIKFRRLKDKKVVGKNLRQLQESHCS